MSSDQFDAVNTGGNSKGTIPWLDLVWNYVTFELHVALYNAAAENPVPFWIMELELKPIHLTKYLV